MAFTATELASIANSSLDWYISDNKSPFYQTIQDRPLMKAIEGKKKNFPGGKGDISVAVKGDFGMPLDAAGAATTVPAGGSDKLAGYTHDDTVKFYTPANILRAHYPWREHHIGLTLTHTQLKMDGISVTDEEGNGSSTSNHSQREMTALVNMLEDALFDFSEQYARQMNKLYWGDGTSDAKALAGLTSLITETPASGTVGGIDRAVHTWWQNIADLQIVSAATGGGVLATKLQHIFRQLRKFGGKPSLVLCGSAFLEALEAELRANGNYSMTGFAGGKDLSVGDITFNGLTFKWDPTLDDLSKSKYCYIIDQDAIKLYVMDGEWHHTFTPSRPPEKFVMYRSMTDTCQLVANRLNSSAVLSIK